MQEFLQGIIKEARLRRVPRSQFLLHQGDVPLDAFILKSGVVKMCEQTERGEKILHLLRRDAVMPFAFFSGPHQIVQWAYMTLTDCEVFVLPYERLIENMREDSNAALELMHWFSLEVHELLIRLSSMEQSTVKDKVLAALRFLAERHAVARNGGWCRVTFPVSHQLIASMVGVSRESVTMSLGELQKEKIIKSEQFTTLDIHTKRLSSEASQG
jgi:CRP/FNR family transcriptional regulator